MIQQPKFFKASTAEGANGEFKKCMPVGVQTSFLTMSPAIATAEQLRLMPYLGKALFDRAAAYYASHETADNTLDQLIELIQMTVVRMAYWDSFDQLAVMIKDNGMSDSQGENRVYRYQADALRASLLRQGHEWLNRTLEFCTENVATLTEFQQSEYYAERSESVVHGLADFERHIGLNHDFTVFAKLREWLESTETMELPYRLGDSLNTVVHTSPDETRIIPLMNGIRGFVCHWAMAEAAPFLSLQPTANGLVVVNEKANDGAQKRQATPEQIAVYAKQHRDAAERYIGQVVTYCKHHRDIYPEIDEIGPAQAEHDPDLIDNHGHKTFVFA
ncbi:MAG: hypothetical protein II674_00825 [Prevotella sp.]|nr:hypothetical protein [Prevotella sp.]